MRNSIGLIIALSVLAACGDASLIQEDTSKGFYTTKDGKILTWEDGKQIQFSIHGGVPREYRAAIRSGGETYNEALINTRIAIDTESGAPDIRNSDTKSVQADGTNGVYWLSEPWPWQQTHPNADAMTVVTYQRSRIVEADIFFRSKSFPVRTNNGSTSGETGFQPTSATRDEQWVYVMSVHEFGHALGRTHSPDQDSIMNPTVGLDFVANPLPQKDRQVLSLGYLLNLFGN